MTYYVMQIDDEGKRCISKEHKTPASAARAASRACPWVDEEAFAYAWFANHPEGGERLELWPTDDGGAK